MLLPQRRTAARLRATQVSLSACVPRPVAQWKSSCALLASVMFTTAGFEDARRRRSRRRVPSSHAVSAVKWGKMQRSSSAVMASSCSRENVWHVSTSTIARRLIDACLVVSLRLLVGF